jgi:hypothetical protein
MHTPGIEFTVCDHEAIHHLSVAVDDEADDWSNL